jgi:hypothetical protein
VSAPRPAERRADPGLLEIAGLVAELLGLADRVLPLGRLRVERQHKRIRNLLEKFASTANDARKALRVVMSTIEKEETRALAGALHNLPEDAVRFDIPASELPILARGIDDLHVAIRAMTKIAFALEDATAALPDDLQRFHRISESGGRVLERLRSALGGQPSQLPALLRDVERFLERCAGELAERDRWLEE